MMVVFIIGLAASVAVMTLPARETTGDRALREVRQALQDAHDRSVLTGEVIGLHPTETGLTVVSWTGQEWLPVRGGDIALPEDVRLTLLPPETPGRRREEAPERIIFNPLGAADSIELGVSWRSMSHRLAVTPDGEVVDATAG
jgi:hypothetical protein